MRTSTANEHHEKHSQIAPHQTAPCENCSRPILTGLSRPLCPVCWPVVTTCEAELVGLVTDLANQAVSRDALLFRVADILRRSGVDDSDLLLRELEARLLA